MTNGKGEDFRKNYISTHTLTWSVTVDWLDLGANILNFNSHAHVERDNIVIRICNIIDYFNSHAHVERDYLFAAVIYSEYYFNSHAHVERDAP